MGYLDSPNNTGLPALVEKWFRTVSTKVSDLFDRVRALDEPEVVTVSGDFAMTAENVVEYNGSGGNTVSLPPASAMAGRRSRPRCVMNTGSGTLTVGIVGSDTLNGVTATTIPSNAMAIFLSNGSTRWRCLGAGFRATSLTLTGVLSAVGASFSGTSVTLAASTFLSVTGSNSGSYLGNIVLGNRRCIQVGTGYSNIPLLGMNQAVGEGLQICSGPSEKLGFWGAVPAVQQVLPTGAGKTADDIITALQATGLCRQS